MADDPVLQSQLLQLWTMLTTNPDLFVSVTPAPWNANDAAKAEAAKPVIDTLREFIPKIDNPTLTGLAGATVEQGNPDSTAPGMWEKMREIRQVYQSFAVTLWSGGTPHPGGNELATFFNQNPVPAPNNEE